MAGKIKMEKSAIVSTTKAGIHGKVAEMNEDTVVVETMAGKIKMEKSAISMEMSAKLAAK
jgi:preprotein translocase subunit YajC